MILNGAATTQTAKSAKQILAIRRLNAVQSRHHKTVTKKTEKNDQREKQRGKNVKGRTDVICR